MNLQQMMQSRVAETGAVYANNSGDLEADVKAVEVEVTVEAGNILAGVDVPHEVAPVLALVPDGPEEPAGYWHEMARKTERGRYSETEMLALLQRLSKGAAFMLEHLYDERGEAKLDDFIKVVEGVQNQVTAYRTLKILSA